LLPFADHFGKDLALLPFISFLPSLFQPSVFFPVVHDARFFLRATSFQLRRSTISFAFFFSGCLFV